MRTTVFMLKDIKDIKHINIQKVGERFNTNKGPDGQEFFTLIFWMHFSYSHCVFVGGPLGKLSKGP